VAWDVMDLASIAGRGIEAVCWIYQHGADAVLLAACSLLR
jgi:hypothetical protein